MGSSLVGEDPTCLGTTKSVGQNYCPCSGARELQLLKPVCPGACALGKRRHRSEKPAHKSNPRSLQLEKCPGSKEHPAPVPPPSTWGNTFKKAFQINRIDLPLPAPCSAPALPPSTPRGGRGSLQAPSARPRPRPRKGPSGPSGALLYGTGSGLRGEKVTPLTPSFSFGWKTVSSVGGRLTASPLPKISGRWDRQPQRRNLREEN
ncbi:translation initiation factor IF-2-like [Cervus canadensis]|uniref:translation initiation factor IF-2-like n=1 Tax=Cervus canadensis TaxID=1574408 RepID=UPI001CA318CB|nr:translation initiation factor IF-2-like [Cervus canadensis]